VGGEVIHPCAAQHTSYGESRREYTKGRVGDSAARWPQAAALRWVRDEIAHGFGGDPGNVTAGHPRAAACLVHDLRSKKATGPRFTTLIRPAWQVTVLGLSSGGTCVAALLGCPQALRAVRAPLTVICVGGREWNLLRARRANGSTTHGRPRIESPFSFLRQMCRFVDPVSRCGGACVRRFRRALLSLSDYASALLFIWTFVWGVV
jgi:hypothetical protein